MTLERPVNDEGLGNRITTPLGRPATQRDVAERAGVSTATVSYVLSGRRDRLNPVTANTRQRIFDAVSELGYQRNHAGRSLRRRRTESVGVVHQPPSSPWLDRLTEQLHDAAVEHGYGVMVLPAGSDGMAASVARMLRERLVDGAILAPNTRLPAADLTALARQGLSLVAFDDQVTADGFDVVRQDQARACREAVTHLVRRGHRRIAYFGHGAGSGPPDDDVKHAAYRQAMAEHDLPVDESLVVTAGDSRSAAYVAATAMWRRADRPTALFSASDRAAIAAIWAAQQSGLSLPDDVAVVGVGNTDEGAVINPALTSVGTPAFDFTPVVSRLFERLAAPSMAGTVIRQHWELIQRQSG